MSKLAVGSPILPLRSQHVSFLPSRLLVVTLVKGKKVGGGKKQKRKIAHLRGKIG
jgi:hypothetical protein